MAKGAIDFPERNYIIGDGGNPNTSSLPVAICLNEAMSLGQPIPYIVSKWEMRPEEIAQIVETGCVYIIQSGLPIQPVVVTGKNPIKLYGYNPVDPETLK